MQNSYSTNTILIALKKWRFKLAIFVIIATIAGSIIALLLPKQYISSSTVIPSNPKAVDKNFLYSNNLLELNSAYGMEEDLDRLLTSLRLSSNFSKLVDSFKLIEHYHLKKNKNAKANATEILVKSSSVMKTDNGAIQITFWDEDKNMSTNLCNALVAIAEYNNNQANQQINYTYLAKLQQQLQQRTLQLNNLDTLANATIKEAQKKALIDLIEKDITAQETLKLSTSSNLSSIIVMEKAYPSDKPDKPKVMFWIIASFISSLCFGIAVAILLEMYRKR